MSEPRFAEDAVRAALQHASYYSAYPSAAAGAFLGALREAGFMVEAIPPPVSAELHWLIAFEDPDHEVEVFTGDGAEGAARRRFDEARLSWNCTLFLEHESSPVRVAAKP